MPISKIKTSFICRGIESYQIDNTLNAIYLPKAGDVAVFEVVSLGKHTRVLDAMNVHRTMIPGDLILGAFGARYASAQFEGYVPRQALEIYHMLGQGGIMGELASTHVKYEDIGPSCFRLVGYACNESGQVLNTHYYANPAPKGAYFQPAHTLLSVGSSMDSGKTTTAAYMVHGLKKAGLRTAFIKLTGTAYSKDAQLAEDLGADISVDFSYFGYPSTYLCPAEEIITLFERLMVVAGAVRPDAVVIEIADGLLQGETAALLQSSTFMNRIDHVVLSAGDSLGMLGGLEVLANWGIRPLALSGLITTSPLLMREIEGHTKYPILGLNDWIKPENIQVLLKLYKEKIMHNAITIQAA